MVEKELYQQYEKELDEYYEIVDQNWEIIDKNVEEHIAAMS